MARSILDIIINTVKQGGGDKETVKGLVAMKQNITQAIGVFGALAGAAYAVDKVLDETVGTYVEYGQKVRDAKTALGLSAEETSRVIALTDDLGISYEELSKSIKSNADNTNYSIDGLAAASAEYLALGSAQERAKFAQENYGKSWAQFAKLLEKGPDQVREMAAAVDDAHIFDEEDLQRVEKYRMGLDKLNDGWEGMKMQIGEKIIPVLNNMFDSMDDNSRALELAAADREKFGLEGEKNFDVYLKLAAAEREQAEALNDTSAAMEGTGESAQELAEKYKDLLGLTMDLQKGYDEFSSKEEEIQAKIADVNKEFADGNITLEERQSQLQELSADLDANAKAAEEWSKRTVFSLVQARLAASGEGIDANEFAFLIDLGENMGIIDEKTATMAQNVNDSLNDIDLSKPEDFYGLWKDILALPHEQEFQVNVNTTYTGQTYTGGTGNNGQNPGGGGYDTLPGGGNETMTPPVNASADSVTLTRSDLARMSGGGRGGGRSLVIHNLTIYAKGTVMDVLEELN